jgi:hypothetical protein
MGKKRAGRKSGGDDDTGEEQVEILRGIWNEMKALNARLETTNERLDQVRTDLNERIDLTNERIDRVRIELKDEVASLRRRVVESEVRLANNQLSIGVQELTGLIREWRVEVG